ncbi:MAG: GldG family protein [Firmicutes bacterium]|nr:GldG family protein [Bacillota bacterium]
MNKATGPETHTVTLKERLPGLLAGGGFTLAGISLILFFLLPRIPWAHRSAAAAAALALLAYAYLERAGLGSLARRRSTKHGINALVQTIAVIGIIVMINVLVAGASWRLDLTRGSKYSLSEQTTAVLANLDRDLKITYFSPGGNPGDQDIRDLLDEYARRSPRFRLEVIDPERSPSTAQAYKAKVPGSIMGSVFFESGERIFRVDPLELFQEGDSQDSINFAGEQGFTRAILEVAKDSDSMVYFLEGHMEQSLEGELAGLKSYLEGDGHSPRSLNLIQEGKIPGDARFLVMAGPQRDLDRLEREEIRRYALERGGRLVVMLDPGTEALPELDALLGELGLTAHQDVLADPERSYFFDLFSLVPRYDWHDITQSLIDKNLPSLLPQARSLAGLDTPPAGITVEGLLETSESSWGETNFTESKASKGPDDLPGPLYVAYAVSYKEGDQADSKVRPVAVVVGTSSFIAGEFVTFPGNADLFLNSIRWLGGERELISIRPKARTMERLFLDPGSALRILFLTVIVIPGATLLSGTVIWLRRRNR